MWCEFLWVCSVLMVGVNVMLLMGGVVEFMVRGLVWLGKDGCLVVGLWCYVVSGIGVWWLGWLCC